MKEAIKVPDQTLVEKDDAAAKETIDSESKPKKNPAVTRERIERLKKAFRPNWLLDSINSVDKSSSKHK